MNLPPHTFIALFVGLFGLCVGSFLNVVIYRLPRGLSVGKPRRSFCPHCQTPIAAFDNIPVLSWLLLRGKCRHCAAPISVQYPLVEAVTGLLFSTTYFLLFVARSRVAGMTGDACAPLAAELPGDLPLLLCWLTLVAAMIACSATDLTSFMVDTRVTNLALIIGVVAHAVWPRPQFMAATATGAWGCAGLLAGLAVLAMFIFAPGGEDDEHDEIEDDKDAEKPSANLRLLGVLGVLALAGLGAWLLASIAIIPHVRHLNDILPLPAVFLAAFLLIVAVGAQQREADDEVAAEIEDEAPQARRTALKDLAWLTPIVIVAALAYAAVLYVPAVASSWRALATWSPGLGITPVGGAAFAVYGAIVGAAAGWALRIVFTLAFGREAFGVGDIYILAAAGATAGWDIALIGLVLSVGLALAGWLLSLVMKSTVMIPFGPWLALGFLMALWLNDHAAQIGARYADQIRFAYENQPHLLWTFGGLMLIALPASFIIARLVRRLTAPEH